MRRGLGLTAAALTAWLASACPVYDDIYCSFDADCAPGLLCDVQSGQCYASDVECSAPLDCSGPNETCGADGYCHVGDCYFHGCVAEYECIADDSGYRCVGQDDAQPSASQGGAAGTTSGTHGGADGSAGDATRGGAMGEGEAGTATAAGSSGREGDS